MKNAYKVTERITRLDGALLHRDGPTFKEALSVSLESFGRDGSDNHIEISLFDFSFHNPTKVIGRWSELPSDEPMRCFTSGYNWSFMLDSQQVARLYGDVSITQLT